MAYLHFTFALVTMLVLSQGVSAKRGCSAFGHSCFGGHGKRSDSSALDSGNGNLLARNQLGQEETPPHPGYPRSSYNLLPSGDDIIPIRDGGVYDRDDSAARDVMKLKLRNLVNHWMQMYRRAQANDDAYLMDTQ